MNVPMLASGSNLVNLALIDPGKWSKSVEQETDSLEKEWSKCKYFYALYYIYVLFVIYI